MQLSLTSRQKKKFNLNKTYLNTTNLKNIN